MVGLFDNNDSIYSVAKIPEEYTSVIKFLFVGKFKLLVSEYPTPTFTTILESVLFSITNSTLALLPLDNCPNVSFVVSSLLPILYHHL